jgi:imidazolonepropionase-like amidohydrolase
MKIRRPNLATAFLLAIGGTVLFASALGASAPGEGRGLTAVRAGTIHLVEDGQVLTGGATILIQDGRILSVGREIDIPADAQIVDYGPDAVIVPGLVAAHSNLAPVRTNGLTAHPGLQAIGGFDYYANYAHILNRGVTTTYLAAAENRLLGGQGAVVKLSGEDVERRTLRKSAVLQGAIDGAARNSPGYWKPPVPATADNDLGYAERQLPQTTMGAIVALDELLALARAGEVETVYGEHATRELAKLLDSGVPWRMAATTAGEIRALLRFATENDLQLILDRANEAADLAEEIADAGASVVFRLPFLPSRTGQDHGKSPDAHWPDFSVPAALAKAGAPVAIASSSPQDLLFAAGAASKGGLDPETALRAITLTPAEILGVADRVGSLRSGKDADLVVLAGDPLSGQATVLATWCDGETVWQSHETSAVVLEVEELHVGDGTVLRPAQLLMMDGDIVEIGERVSHPLGAPVIRGKVAMPGMIDTLGHLGLEGSGKVLGLEYRLGAIVAPGDDLDRRVATAGITTVALTSRGVGGGGTPVMAYKPAGEDLDSQVIGDPVAVRLRWTDRNRLNSGKAVRSLLERAGEYRTKWLEYEKAIAAWTPPPPEPAADEEEEEEDEEKAEEKEDEEDGDKKKKKKKKGEKEELEPDPVTGLWTAEVVQPPQTEAAPLRLRILLEDGEGSGAVHGNLRCAAVSEGLISLEGFWDREELSLQLAGLGSLGWLSLSLTLEEGKFGGTLVVGGGEMEISATREAKDFVVAERPERRAGEPAPKAPKGKPKQPKLDQRLEPLKSALEGTATIFVEVEREDEILDCVTAFEKFGIKPVLFGAGDSHLVADRLVGRVSGILLSPEVLRSKPEKGTQYRTPWADIQNAGIPVAFYSRAEEGAVDLPMMAAYAVANGMSPTGALRALTSDAARMLSISARVGRLEDGLDADVLLLDGPPLAPGTSVLRTWVNGIEVR